MNLNYTAFFLISFVPLLLGLVWYRPNSRFRKWAGVDCINPFELSFIRIILLLLLSLLSVYCNMILTIHQLGFYQLFFTDIMMGSEQAEIFVKDFLELYGDKYRYFKHGVFHGVINACIVALPYIGINAILEKKSIKYFFFHFFFWLITSVLLNGLIAEFI